MISIIVPIYNVEKYLPKCIESIINQTYTDLEILLIDDGSTDNSGLICDKYASIDNRIRVIHKKNGGLSDARNVGLDICKGKYISFIDSDDYIELTMYEKMIKIMINQKVDIVSCNYNHIYNNNKIPFFKIKTDELIEDKNLLYERIFTYNNFDLVVFNKLYNSIIFKNIRFPIGISPAEDLNILYDVINISNKFYCLSEALYNKIERYESLSHTTKIKDYLNNVNAYENLLIKIKNDRTLDYNKILKICSNNLFTHYKHLLDKIYMLNNIFYNDLEKITIKKICTLYNKNLLKNKNKRKVYLLKISPNLYKKYRILSTKWKILKNKRRTYDQ